MSKRACECTKCGASMRVAVSAMQQRRYAPYGDVPYVCRRCTVTRPRTLVSVVSRQGVRFGNTIRFGPDAQQFDLVATIWRTGASTQLGHFVAVCRYGSAWFVMNDAHISQVESAQSTSPPLPGAAVKMLFYCSTESGVAAAAKATGAKRRLFFGHS